MKLFQKLLNNLQTFDYPNILFVAIIRHIQNSNYVKSFCYACCAPIRRMRQDKLICLSSTLNRNYLWCSAFGTNAYTYESNVRFAFELMYTSSNLPLMFRVVSTFGVHSLGVYIRISAFNLGEHIHLTIYQYYVDR